MKTRRGAVWATALVVLGLSGATANASWCNAFEVCWHRNQTTTAQYYAPPASVAYYVAPATTSYYAAPAATSYYAAPAVSYYAAPATTSCAPPPSCAPSCTPCQSCQTNYVQRSYYQPVTEYQSQSYYEKVTSYSTSYYYEPVTSYSYSSYYDACSCSYQQVAQPTVSYSLRAQSCPVENWVQRCQKVPVTTYKMSYYLEPVTTCSSAPVVAAAPPCNSCNNTAAAPQQAAIAPPPSNYQPDSSWQKPPAGVSESTRTPGALPNDRVYPPSDRIMPSATGSSYQPNRQGAAPGQRIQTAPVQPPAPTVHLDRFVSAPRNSVSGQVVLANWQPASATRLIFINAERQEARREVATDNTGRFQAQLNAGNWLVYIEDARGKPVFSQEINVRSNDRTELLRLVSR